MGGVLASDKLGITNEIAAADLDSAVAIRLTMFDTELSKTNAQRIAYEVGKLFGGEDSGGTTSVEPGVEIW